MKIIAGPIKGYKITDKDMKCRGYQYELGKIHILDNEKPLIECGNGFHFCEQPSGVWGYYNTGRVFEIEAWDVLDTNFQPGADYKRVCRKIRFIREVKIDGNRNTGYRNTGDRNTGDRNTGYGNTGYSNTGYSNTGDRNTGDRNTGYGNTGNRNTGDGNTGYGNTGDGNTGYGNTGDGNTGDYNTGDGNCTFYSSGFFCKKEVPLLLFDKKCNLPRNKLPIILINELAYNLSQDEPFDISRFLDIPNATECKIKALHKAHIEARKAATLTPPPKGMRK
jgi:hypothetical protein